MLLISAVAQRVLKESRDTALAQLSELPPAPSVGLHDVPRESVGDHLGLTRDDHASRDELDDRLAREPSAYLPESEPMLNICCRDREDGL